MHIHQISDEDLEFIIEEIQENIDFPIIQRGWDYYSSGHVADLRLEQGSVLAEVAGSQLYHVSIDTLFFSISSCTCPFGGYCKHMVAVFLQLCYEQGKRPELIYLEWKRQEQHRDHFTTMIETRKQAAVRKAEKGKQARTLEPKEFDTVQQWHSFLEQKYKHYVLDSYYALDSFYDSVSRGINSYCQTWNPVMRNLFHLQGLLFVLLKVETSYLKKFAGPASYHHYEQQYYVRFAEQCVSRIVELTQHTQAEEAQRMGAAGLLDTSVWLRERLLSGKESPVSWLLVYRMIWWNLMQVGDWLRKEREALEAMTANGALPAKVEDLALLALLHLDVLLGEDREAIGRFERLTGQKRPDYLFSYLHHFSRYENKERLLLWLRWLLPWMKSGDNGSRYRYKEIGVYCQLWSEAVQEHSVEGEWGEVMRSLLPGSYVTYTEQLLALELYRQWADVQLLLSVDPVELGSSLLRKVESKDAASLLPIYHLSIERHILQKNRTSYRAAVKLMKKLEKCYKRLKRLQRWEDYVRSVAAQYARYRALQEEMRKGKLIS